MRLLCEQCGVKYERSRNIKYRHKDYCSLQCREDWIDVQSQVLGAFIDQRDPRYAVIPMETDNV